MDQRQKHWVQAMLNEDTYVPFPYFYDVTAWSQPLLYDVGGGYSGAQLTMATPVVGAVPDPGVPAPPADAPSIALYSMSPTFTRGIESSGWLRWLLDRWGLEYEDVSAADIAGGALAGHDVLLVPDGYATRDPSVEGRPVRAQGPRARPARPRSGPGCRAAAATSAGSTARCSPRRSGSPRRSSRTPARRASARRAR